MKTLTNTLLLIAFSLLISGCAIPDMPGPIGIPGIEAEPLTLQN